MTWVKLPDTDSRAKMLALLNLTNVPRFTITPHTGHQSVGEHSFRVAVIAMELASRVPSSIITMEALLRFSLTHDIAESATGDIPAPFKQVIRQELASRKLGGYFALMEEQVCPWITSEFDLITDLPEGDDTRHIVKVADMVEAMTYIQKWGVGYRAKEARDFIGEKINDYILRAIDGGDIKRDEFSLAYREVVDTILLD